MKKFRKWIFCSKREIRLAKRKKIRETNSFVTNCFHEFFVKRMRDTVLYILRSILEKRDNLSKFN